jgi:son of sevenless-like protein
MLVSKILLLSFHLSYLLIIDPKFSKAFLMTYKTFITLDELFRLLVERFWIQPPEGLDSSELVEWRKLKQQIIRIR